MKITVSVDLEKQTVQHEVVLDKGTDWRMIAGQELERITAAKEQIAADSKPKTKRRRRNGKKNGTKAKQA